MSLSVLNYRNQCSKKKSEDSLKIFCTPEAFGVKRRSKTFAVMFFLLVRNIEAGKWASATDELRLDGHEITAKYIISF